MPPRLRLALLALIALAAAAATVGTVVLLQDRSAPAAAGEPARNFGGAFALVDQDGRAVTQADFRGRYLLMFFGFTQCPDVCPMTLQRVADALERAPAVAARLTAVLVSVDPERDTPAALKAYVSYFGPSFRGLTGTPEQIGAVLKAYGVYARKAKLEDSQLGYTIDHSSLLYLYDPDGVFVTVFDPSMDAEILAARLQDNVK